MMPVKDVQKQKKVIPPPGRKLTTTEARDKAFKQYGKALAMLAK